MKRTSLMLLLAATLSPLAVPGARGNWGTNGVVIDEVPNPGSDPPISWGVVGDGTGGCYGLWERSDSLRVQHVSNSGVVTWASGGVLLGTPLDTDEWTPIAVPDGTGGLYALWDPTGFQGSDLAQRLTIGGTPALGWPPAGLEMIGVDLARPTVDDAGDLFVFDDPLHKISTGGTLLWGSGIPVSPWFTNCVWGAAASDGAGGVYVGCCWDDDWNDAIVMRFTEAGAVAPGWPPDGFTLGTGRVAAALPGPGGSAYFATAREESTIIHRCGLDGQVFPGWPAEGVAVYSSTPTGALRAALMSHPDGGATVITGLRFAGGARITHLDSIGHVVWGHTIGSEFVWGATETDAGDVALLEDGFLTPSTDIHMLLHVLSPAGTRATPAAGVVLVPERRADRVDESGGTRQVASSGLNRIVCCYDAQLPPFTGTTHTVAVQQAATRSDVLFSTPVDWYDVAVPIPFYTIDPPDPTGFELIGNTEESFVNWSVYQGGPNAVPIWRADLRLDLEEVLQTEIFSDGDLPLTNHVFHNPDPVFVRGGRHCLTAIADPNDELPESDEANNVSASQYVWSPALINDASPLNRIAPPNACFGLVANPSGDGFEYHRTPSYAWVIASAGRTEGDDYDLWLYDDYSDALNGFSNLIGYSGQVTNETDFVVGHYANTPEVLYPEVVRWDAAGGGSNLLIDPNDAENRNAGNEGSFTGVSLAMNRLADVYEAFLNAGETISFSLERTVGTADLAVRIFPGEPGTISSRASALAASVPVSDDTDAMTFTATVTGWHPIVVYRTTGGDADAARYDLTWAPAATDAPDVSGAATPQLAFHGASPNPATTETRLTFDLPSAQSASLTIYDVSGRRVRRLVDGPQPAGRQSVSWDRRSDGGERVSAGVYFARFEAGAFADRKRIVLVN
ncbi:MAG: FlgD immunoglobulin-like domain containing protein [bacterium]